jgi:hypothetical protein
MTRPKSGEGVSCLIVMSEDIMRFKTVELILELSYLPVICRHAGVTAIRFPHDLVDDELRVLADVEPLNPKHDGNAQAVDEGLIFYHIVGCTEI